MHGVFLLSIDWLLLCIANALGAVLSLGPHATSNEFLEILPHLGWTLAIAIPVLLVSGLNRTLWRFTSFHDCLRVFTAVSATVALAVATSGAFSYLQTVPQSLVGSQIICMTGILIGVRGWMRLKHIHRKRRNFAASNPIDQRETIIVIGVNDITALVLRRIAEYRKPRMTVAGILSESPRHAGRLFDSCPVLGTPDEIEDIMQDLEVHGVQVNRIVLTEPLHQLSQNAQHALMHAKLALRITIDTIEDPFAFQGLSVLHNTPVTGADIRYDPNPSNRRTKRPYLFWKRAFDIVASGAIAICLAPLIVLISVLVWFDVGHPIIFWQQRPGASGRPIKVLKFRTMRGARGPGGARLPDHQRLSQIGKLLRRMRFDEFPQVLNVLAGEMSMVGPRPLLPIDQSEQFRARLDMKPGLTGWAQINGGRHLSINDKAVLDLWYVKNASALLDLRILLRTAHTILFGERIDASAIRKAWMELGYSASTGAIDHNHMSEAPMPLREAPHRWLDSRNAHIQAPRTESLHPHS